MLKFFTNPSMKISVIIPAYNEERLIGNCLRSCIQHAPKNLIEIIVVSNACTDQTENIALKFPGVRVVQELIKGTGHARQKGFESAQGDILAFLDADTHIHANWFTDIEREFTNNPLLACLSGPCMYDDLPAWKCNMIYICWMAAAMPTYWLSGYAALGGNFVVKRSSLVRVGGFDTTINFYGDDTNIARRLYGVGDVKFSSKFYNFTSSRRFRAQGLVHVSARYCLNHVSQMIWKETITKAYGERPWETSGQDLDIVNPTTDTPLQTDVLPNILRIIQLRDGRSLEFAEYGDMNAKPILYFHGFLGSCNQAAFLHALAIKEGMHVIAPNRPGIGKSSPKRFANMTEYSDDIEQLATALNINKFSVFGISAGGSFALACAHSLSERVELVGIASCMGPLSAIENRQEMHWLRLYIISCLAYWPTTTNIILWWAMLASNVRPQWLYKKMMLTESVTEIAECNFKQLEQIFKLDYDNIFLQKNGMRALINEAHLYFNWGFNTSSFPKQVPVIIWHGTEDTVIPWSVMQAVTVRIENHTVHLIPGGHLSFISHIAEVAAGMKAASDKIHTMPAKLHQTEKESSLLLTLATA